MTMRV